MRWIRSRKDHFSFVSAEGKDLAYTIQRFTEDALVSLVKNLAKKYGIYKFCLSGGVFLNCLSNHKILEKADIEDVRIFPAAGDDGQAIGCALHVFRQRTQENVKPQIHLPYLGLSYSDEFVEKHIKSKNIKAIRYSDKELVDKLADLIANGKIIGVFRGRTEVGPRALCHRSILADPTNPNMKDILNKRIKHREEFRPFAPVTTYEDQFNIFDLKADSPFMLLATTVKKEYQDIIPSVTHVDKTARVQAIKREEEPFLYALLRRFEDIKGIPVLLNTSFNLAGQPIVELPDIAIQTFLRSSLDVLVLNNYLICKEL